LENLSLITKSKILKENRLSFVPYCQYLKYQETIKLLLAFCLRHRKCEALREIIKLFNVGELYRDVDTLTRDIDQIKEEEK
jgi:hypothetical protein